MPGTVKHDVEIGDRQQVGFDDRQATGRAPSPGTLGSACRDSCCRQCGPCHSHRHIALEMAAERRGAAGLDGGHDAALVAGQEPTALGGTERIAVAAEDVRHLHRGTHVPLSSAGGITVERELIERARASRRLGPVSDLEHSGPSSTSRWL